MAMRRLPGQESFSSSDSAIGLRFGKKTYFENAGRDDGRSSSSSLAPSPLPASSSGKKGKTAAHGGQQQQHPPPPRCQVEGCDVDLGDAKPYYSRHKVCGLHSKAPRVIVAGLEQRFCQQCSRFHMLPEFDQGKRSCRRRLAGHNERRRKPPPPPGGLLSSRPVRLPSSFHVQHPLGEEDSSRYRGGGFMMDFTYPRSASATADDATLFSTPETQVRREEAVTSCALSLLSTNRPWAAAAAAAAIPSDHPFPSPASCYLGVGGDRPSQPVIGGGGISEARTWGFEGHDDDDAAACDATHSVHLPMQFSGELELALQGRSSRQGRMGIDPDVAYWPR